MRAEEIKQSIDLADYVRTCGIELKPHGKNDLKGLCPFHSDHHPSLIITPSKKLFNCPVCSKGGSVIDFVMLRENVDFKTARQTLLDTLGNQSPQESLVTVEDPSGQSVLSGRNHRLLTASLSPERANQLLEKVISYYEKTFADVPEGRDYLESRGITDAGLYSTHRIGYCNSTLPNILPKSGKIHNELSELGILFDSGKERLTGCIVIPLFDVEGNIVTLYGRYTGNDSTKKHMFLPNRSKGLWNVTAIKTYPEIILVESIIDGLSVQMAGQHNVVSIQGTNGFNNGQADLLSKHGVQNLTYLLDGDEAGQNTGQRLIAEKTSSFSNKVFTLPNNHDPNSYLVEYGPQKLAEFIAQIPVPEPQNKSEINHQSLADGGFVVTYGLRRYEIHGLEKGARKLKATIRIELAGKLHVDTLDFYSARARRTLAQDICRISEQPTETIESDINKLLLACENYNPDQITKTTTDPGNELSVKERQRAEEFGKSSDLLKKILADYDKCGLVGEKHNKLLCYLAAISRKMNEPLSVLILSSSGAGKTALQDATLLFCPPEDVVKLTSLSGKALFYKDESSLKHKILALEEGDGAEEASYAIRNLISSGVLVIEPMFTT